jgi:hypothetical protein
MAKVTIAKKFTLNRDDGSSVTYGPGNHDMPDADADHWYTKLHLDEPKAEEKAEEKGDAKDSKGKGAK